LTIIMNATVIPLKISRDTSLLDFEVVEVLLLPIIREYSLKLKN
jgi:hypothetical protein